MHMSMEVDPRVPGRTRLGTTWRIVLFVTIPLGAYAPLDVYVRRHASGHPSALERLVLECAAFVCVGIASLIAARLSGLSMRDMGVVSKRGRTEMTAGLLGGSVWLVATVALLCIPGWVRSGPPWHPDPGALLLALGAGLANVGMQELLFRGYPYAVSERRHGARVAVWVTTLLFILLHAGAAKEAPVAFLNLALAGILMAELRRRTGALFAPFGVHYAWNMLVGPIAGLSVSGYTLGTGAAALQLDGPSFWVGGSFGIEATLATTVTTALALLLLWRRERKVGTEPRTETRS